MDWSEQYDGSGQPTLQDISDFIHHDLWRDMNGFLHQTYGVQPQIAYSACSAQRGWNVKYKKNGKSLCTLYPMYGYFIALVVIGTKETAEAELLMPLCSAYTQNLYQQTVFSTGGRWLMMDVTDEKILEDVKNLIKLRVKPRQ